jgi:hypothetical protein
MAANQGIKIQTEVTGLSQAEKLARALDMVAKHSERVGKQRTAQYFNQNEKAISRVNREMQRNLVLQQQSGKSTRRMELGFQQAGYQFQDLVVQLQGGVNPFVAISQQGSQLASFFAGPWGASIGLAIAALGALGTAFLSSKTEAASLQEELGKMEELEGLLKDFGKEFGQEFILSIDNMREKFGEFASDVYEFRVRKFQEAIREEFESTGDSLLNSFSTKATGMSGQAVGRGQGMGILRQRQQEVDAIVNQMFSEGITSTTQFREVLQKVGEELKALGYVPQEQLDVILQLADKYKVIEENVKTQTEEQEAVNDALEEQVKLTEKLKGLEQDKAIEEKKANAALLKQQGYKIMALDLEKQAAAEILTNKAMQLAEGKELTTEQQRSLDAAIKSAQEALQLKFELGEAKDKASELAKELAKAESALNSMKNFGNGLETALAKAKAEATALATGADVATAKAIAGFRSQREQKIQGMIDAKVEEPFIQAERERSKRLIDELETILNENAAETKRQRDAAKAGRSAQSDQDKYDEYLRRQQVELDLRQKLVFMTDDQIKRAEYESELREKAAQLGVEVNEKAVQGLMDQYDMIVKLEKKRDLVNDIGDAFGDTLMAVADGSMKIRDAFQKLMFDIAKMIYQQAIVDPLVDELKSALFQADGGVHSRGNVVPFANGGVVNGPTLFPMSGGTGIMGEAGPEAIMPLKRGRDGKLGVAGGSTTVVQNFNFSANGDESVKRIIAQEAPKIADMTQASIMDSRRRGGSMRKAFG